MIYLIITVIKAVVIIVGMTLAMLNLIPGLKNDKKKIKKAAYLFISTFLIVALLTVVEFLFMTH